MNNKKNNTFFLQINLKDSFRDVKIIFLCNILYLNKKMWPISEPPLAFILKTLGVVSNEGKETISPQRLKG